MMHKKTTLGLAAVGLTVLVYLLYLPLPTPEMAVRRDVFTTNPIHALTATVHEGKVKNDPEYGDLYIVQELEQPFIYVKRFKLGWYAVRRGTGP
jgi:hypothetical protein